MATTPPRPISQVLSDLKNGLNGNSISVQDLLQSFSDRGIAFFLFLFSLPAAIPLPGLGVNFIIAAPLILLTTQQILGRHGIWFPKRVKSQTISKRRLILVIDKSVPWLKKIEKLVYPRLQFMTGHTAKKIIGLLGFIMALSVCIPLPLTNTVPSFGIALMALGTIMRDGLAVIAGALIGTLWVAMLVSVTIFLGFEGIDAVKETIKSLL